MGRECWQCERYLDSDYFSNNQWRKGEGSSRCVDCVNGYDTSTPRRECCQCNYYLDSDEFSSTQWRKGEGSSRCMDCVNTRTTYVCGECNGTFSSQNALDQHSQVHRPRNVACPVCGETRFRSGANAVQHVESGYCSGCRGIDNARQQIYNFASSQSGMRPYMSNVPQLTYGEYDNDSDDSVPDYPYNCPDCEFSFRNLSQLLQHKDAKHSSMRMLGYY